MTSTTIIVDTPGGVTSVTRCVRAIVARYRRRHGAKRLARVAAVSTRTAQGWLQGRAMPDAIETLLRLAAEHPELADEIQRDVERLRDAAAVARMKARGHATIRVGPVPVGADDGGDGDRAVGGGGGLTAGDRLAVEGRL